MCRKILSLVKTFLYWILDKCNATSGAGTANPSGAHEFTPGF
jgi:hypothetical protein